LSAKQGAVATCPQCARALPPGSARACVHCGAALPLPAARGTSVGFGFTSRPRDPLIGQVVAGRYKLEEVIGQGGMGKVYLARHLSLDRLVCLKMLRPALLEDPTVVGRFEREAKAASRLNHANSIQVLDFGRNESDGTLFIAMEYVQGKDLRVVLRDEWPLPEERLCNIMAQVLAALGEAHAHNVVHRDLKPENIMVEQRPDHTDGVTVLDFGIAKILDSDLPGLTRSDVVCGTPQYMAPEQATGTQLDARCDLYSVGVILYQMATGHLPFDGQNSMEVLTRHVNEAPMPPRQRAPSAPISAAMEALILRALEKEPTARPQTAEEFRQLLLAVPRQKAIPSLRTPLPDAVPRALTPPLPYPTPAVPVARKPLRSFRTLLAAGTLAFALLGMAAILRGWSRPGRAPLAAGLSEAPGAASTRDPQRAHELLLRAERQDAAGRSDVARDLLLQAVALDPDDAETHYRLGALLLRTDPQRSRAEYETAKRLDSRRYAAAVDAILKPR
jgi:tRNA A-37 threonylcarbamoyl transferase component Bud32